ncbi:gag-pol polyprotein [Tanacetum coccineum]|uniref:Gag-pol polyprotein n=1 Tax=Tanacetum coccineum TaxID=301880 RepID=A0ABQ4XN62_9ASTR
MPEIQEYFENKDLKAQLQEKDIVNKKLKERINDLRKNHDNVKKEIDGNETINIVLEHNVAKLLSENENLHKEIVHLKQIYKEQFDSIKKSHVLANEALKNELKRIKGKNVVDSVAPKPKATTISKGMENANVLREIVEEVSASNPLDGELDLACNKKNDRIPQLPHSNLKNKVEAQHRNVTLSASKKNRVKDSICDANFKHTILNANFKHTILNANSELICVKCNQCMFDANHDACFLEYVSDMNVKSKSKSIKNDKKKEEWKPTGKMFTKIGFMWRPTGKKFSLVRYVCPLTRITTTKAVPIKVPNPLEVTLVATRIYARKSKTPKNIGSHSKSKISTSKIANKMEPGGLPCSLVKFLALKYEAPDFIITFLKMIQHRLNASVKKIRIDNGIEFVNQTLRDYYESFGISHETSVAKTPQQNGVVERRNHTLVEAACTIKKAYRIYNRCTWRITETCHVDFDKLTAMASEHSSLEAALHEMTPATPSSRLVPNPLSPAPFVPPTRNEWDLVFTPLFDEFFSPPASVASPVTVVEAPLPVETTCLPSSTTVDQDAPSPSTSQTDSQPQSQEILLYAEEENHDLLVAHMSNDPYFGIPIPKTIYEESSSSDVIPTIVHPNALVSEHISRWTKDHPL